MRSVYCCVWNLWTRPSIKVWLLQDSGNRKFEFSRDHSFGDGYNDERMLNATAVGLVMGNAPTV
jgi:hypothetical protein